MNSSPIKIVSRSGTVPASPAPAVLASDNAPWRGMRLEVHDVPAAEMPERFCFEHNIVGLNCATEPFRKYWRECGREQSNLVRPGDICLIGRDEIVGHRWDRARRLMAIAVDDDSLNGILAEELAGRTAEFSPVPDSSDEVLKRILLHLKNEVALGCPGGRIYGESILIALVSHTIPRYGTVRPVLKQYRRGLSPGRLRRVLEYIDAYLGQSLGVAELASVAGLSQYHFGKLFRRSMGRSVHQYVLDCRIERACHLLKAGKPNLGAIAGEVGMSNTHFSAVFRERVGLTARDYRQSAGPFA